MCNAKKGNFTIIKDNPQEWCDKCPRLQMQCKGTCGTGKEVKAKTDKPSKKNKK
jgi:hypothetical protein